MQKAHRWNAKDISFSKKNNNDKNKEYCSFIILLLCIKYLCLYLYNYDL